MAMDMTGSGEACGAADDAQIAGYRRDGFMVVRGLIAPRLVAAAIDAISGLASGRIPARATQIAFEPGVDASRLRAEDREGFVRKFSHYVSDSEALRAIAMSRRLHAILDRILGEGRELLQDMALIKPPRVGGAKPWHQDASYFRVRDPGLVVGVWIALDPARRENGCMEVIPGSHLGRPVPHVPQEDVNLCTIRPDLVRLADRLHVEMEAGDALIFHCNAIHRSDANRSPNRRWTLLICYNRVDNDTFTKVDDRYYVPLEPVDDDAIRRAGLRFARADGQEHFASKPYVPDLRKVS